MVSGWHASAAGHLNEKTIGHPKKLKTPKMKRKRDMYSGQTVVIWEAARLCI